MPTFFCFPYATSSSMLTSGTTSGTFPSLYQPSSSKTPPGLLPSAHTSGGWRVEFRLSHRARLVGKRCAATGGPQLALLFHMLQGSLLKIDLQDLLPDLTFQLRDPRLLRPFLAHAGKRPLPKLVPIAAPAAQLLPAHFQAARHQACRLTRAQSLHRIQLELLGELPSRPHPSFPFRCILGLNWLSQNRGPLHPDGPQKWC